MTAFITRCWKNALERLVILFLAFALAGVALANEPAIRNSSLALGDDGYALQADLAVELTPRLEEVVSRGVALYFVAEFELTRPRWYWFEETVADRRLTFRLAYNALTRQYRLSTGALHQNFATLEEALHVLSRIRHWTVVDRGGLKSGERYQAALRFRLDMAQLPKPFQIDAIGNRDWALSTDWHRWVVVPDEAR